MERRRSGGGGGWGNNRVLVEGKLRWGQYVNFRQILQYKVNNCQRRHMRIKVPLQGFVKSIPQVCVCKSFADVKRSFAPFRHLRRSLLCFSMSEERGR